MANAEAALVQRVNAVVCPFGVERYREAIPRFALSTKPALAATCCRFGCRMHRRWVLRSAPRTPPCPQSHKLSCAARRLRGLGEPRCLPVGQALAGIQADFTVGLGSYAHTWAAQHGTQDHNEGLG